MGRRLVRGFAVLAGLLVAWTQAVGTPPIARLGAQPLDVRVSVKFVLDAGGKRPESGSFHERSRIEEAIAAANQFLAASDAGWRLELDEVVEVGGISHWLRLSAGSRHRLEAAARRAPEVYRWRFDALNIYVTLLQGFRGFCSFPSDLAGRNEILLINYDAWAISPAPLPDSSLPAAGEEGLAGGWLFLHEIGHYFNLCHTHGCCCNFSCGELQDPAQAPVGDDGVADTLLDLECWGREEISRGAYDTPFAELGAAERMLVEQTAVNVMSYHREAIYARGGALLSAEQLARVAVEMAGRRAHVVAAPEFIRGDCDADGAVSGTVADAVFLLNFNFGRGREPPCLAACDADGDGSVRGTVGDAIYLLLFAFAGGPAPPGPFPECGAWNQADRLLGCAAAGGPCP